MRVAGFVRVSKQEQALGHSPDTQRRVIRDYCRAMDWGEPDWYEDLGVSAWTDEVEDRPAFARMLAACHAGRYERVVVYKLDRWARDILVSVRELRGLRAAGVGFVSVSEQCDFGSPFGQVLFALLSAFAQHYSDLISERTRLGLATKRLKGQPLGRAPYGAVRDERQRFALDPARAPVVRRILELAPVTSWEQLAATLNAEGVPGPRGGRWRETTLRRLVWRSWDWLADEPEPWPSLLDGARRPNWRPTVRGDATTHMLSGLMRCRCGGRPYYSRTRGRARLACRDRTGRDTPGGKGCPYGGLTWADVYEAQVTAQIMDLAAPSERTDAPAPDAAGEAARRELAEDRRRLAATYRARLVDDAEFRRELAALDARAAALARTPAPFVADAEYIVALKALWPGMSGAARNDVLAVLCREVTIAGHTATVRWAPEIAPLAPKTPDSH